MRGFRPGGRKPDAPGGHHARSEVRGQRSAVSGAVATWLRTFDLLMGELVCSQTVPVWSPAGKASSILSHNSTTTLLRELSPLSAG